MQFNRREFILISTSLSQLSAQNPAPEPSGEMDSGLPSEVVNYNCGSAIGMGDEPAGIVDQFGQMRGRHVHVLLDLDSPLKPFQKEERVRDVKWAQWLKDGYLPVVRSKVDGRGTSLEWTCFTAENAGLKGEYISIREIASPLHIRLLFPYVTEIRSDGDLVVCGDRVLAFIPGARRLATRSAKYNLLSPDSWCTDVPRWDDAVPLNARPGLAAPFQSGRAVYLNRSVEYRIPVPSTGNYRVYLGLITDQKKRRGESILKLSVNGQSQLADVGDMEPEQPLVLEFAAAAPNGAIHVASECDASSMSMYRDCFLNGVWVFDAPVNMEKLRTGELDSRALAQIPCGREPLTDVAASLDLEYDLPAAGRAFLFFPHDLPVSGRARVTSISPARAEAAAADHWNGFLKRGAELKVGVKQLDDLYRTCQVNIMLLRTRYAGAANGGRDLYVVKPGATIYNNFWTRDGSYIATALGLSGHAAETEQSLRLFWQHGLKGIFATWGQQPAGYWQAPITQWDSNGQALWALVHHFETTRDRQWLAAAYGSISKGARWIQYACEQMRFTNEKGERPTYYGLLPPGEGESIASGINYYHNFWALLGLRKAVVAAEGLDRAADARVFRAAYESLYENLLASVRTAFERTGKNQFIPATPFDPQASIWGSANAMYPCRFLEPQDPMMTATLHTMQSYVQEDAYVYTKNHLWTYITAELAMCHLLRNERDQFYRLFNGFVAHSSPTHAWVEGILVDNRRGTGDMPHGWAAAEYIFLHRNSLVYENDSVLELCWGVQPGWIEEGAVLSVKRAPTNFGKLEFEVRRKGSELDVNYHLDAAGFPAPRGIRLHVPQVKEPLSAVVVNSTRMSLRPGQDAVRIG